MKILYSLILLISCNTLSAQYFESFDVANKGILIGSSGFTGGCAGDYTTCESYDFTGVSWIISGNLTAVDQEGFYTSGASLNTSDTDEEACFESPTLDISSVTTSSFTVSFTIPTGSGWDAIAGVGSIDFMDIRYSVDGAPFVTLPNQNGCPGSGHTISAHTCSDLDGPLTYLITENGITGNSLKILVCIDTNTSFEAGQINSVSVPEAGTVLPVIWGSFTGKAKEKDNLIEWSLLSEINNDYFDIEKSTNGIVFEAIDKVYATENLNRSNKEYNYLDHGVDQLKTYYRLKQVDFDGQYNYSSTIVVENKLSNKTNLEFGPNPVRDNLMVKISGDVNSTNDLQIVDMRGIIHQSINLHESHTPIINIDCSNLPNGQYILQFKDDRNNYINQEFIKL